MDQVVSRNERFAREVAARIKRLPVTAWQVRARIVIGTATFFDALRRARHRLHPAGHRADHWRGWWCVTACAIGCGDRRSLRGRNQRPRAGRNFA
jgi:hypothetical protein